jgi:ankyrin repeat protein
MICCQGGHARCLALLSDRGADLNLVDYVGFTATHYASRNDKPKCLLVLIKRGADISIKDVNGETPLDYARYVS